MASVWFDAAAAADARDLQALIAAAGKMCDFNLMDADGRSLLCVAAAHGRTETCAMLLKSGAKKAAVARNGWRPLHFAVQSGVAACVECILKFGDLNDANGGGDADAFTLATEINERVPPDQTCALLMAVRTQSAPVVQLLVALGAQLDVQTADGDTPLHLAAASGHLDIVQTLIKAGAPLHTRNHGDLAPLHVAATGDSAAVVDALLAAGADANLVSPRASTALVLSTRAGKDFPSLRAATEAIPEAHAPAPPPPPPPPPTSCCVVL